MYLVERMVQFCLSDLGMTVFQNMCQRLLIPLVYALLLLPPTHGVERVMFSVVYVCLSTGKGSHVTTTWTYSNSLRPLAPVPPQHTGNPSKCSNLFNLDLTIQGSAPPPRHQSYYLCSPDCQQLGGWHLKFVLFVAWWQLGVISPVRNYCVILLFS